jgi:hypothetical protein
MAKISFFLFLDYFFLLASSFIAIVSCDQILVIDSSGFPSSSGVMSDAKSIDLQTSRNVSEQKDGFSICVRVSFRTWYSDQIVFHSKLFTFLMEDFNKGLGIFNIGEFTYKFKLKNQLTIQMDTWNSFCFVYSFSNLSLEILVNGINYFTVIEENNQTVWNQSVNTSITLGWSTFSGQISDFNIWSRPLSLKEIQDFSKGCSPELTEMSNPQYVSWSRVNITRQGNMTKLSNISKLSFCEKNSKPANFENETIILNLDFSVYDDAKIFCKRMNGNMPFPRNETDLKFIFSFQRDESNLFNKSCENNFWLPIIRSSRNKSSWIHDESGVEVTFLPEKSVHSYSSKNLADCLYVNSVSLHYFEVECYFALCSACQINEMRQIFSLKGTKRVLLQKIY